MSGLASALVVNVGTLDPPQVQAMLLAGKKANERNIPVILDPVGAGATTFRTHVARQLLSELDIAVVCGNAGEIATIAGLEAEVRGVESIGGDAREAVLQAARLSNTIVAATGGTDYVSDGKSVLAVENGHPLLGRVVGSGCAATAVIGCFASAGGGDPETVAGSLAFFGRAGEVAAEKADGPGTLEPRLLDAVAALAADPQSLDGTLEVSEAP